MLMTRSGLPKSMGGIRVRPGPIFWVGCSAAATSTALSLAAIEKVAPAAMIVDVMSKYAHVLVRTRQVPGLVMNSRSFGGRLNNVAHRHWFRGAGQDASLNTKSSNYRADKYSAFAVKIGHLFRSHK
jgi:hypothetical protein